LMGERVNWSSPRSPKSRLMRTSNSRLMDNKESTGPLLFLQSLAWWARGLTQPLLILQYLGWWGLQTLGWWIKKSQQVSSFSKI
jgi:hypothetical protein